MKKLVVLLTLATAASAFSQGQVVFTTRNNTTDLRYKVEARVSYAAGGPVAAGHFPSLSGSNTFYVTDGALTFGGPNARIALYAVDGTTTDASTLKMITPNVPFRTGPASGYSDGTYNSGSTTREVPNNTPGQNATFQIRAWDTGFATDPNTYDYEKAVADITAAGKGYFGVGNLFTRDTGGGSLQPTFLTAAQPFTLNWVPEPSIIGLGILGAIAGMVVFRRRQ